jgi:hypothetical protein
VSPPTGGFAVNATFEASESSYTLKELCPAQLTLQSGTFTATVDQIVTYLSFPVPDQPPDSGLTTIVMTYTMSSK